MWLILNADDDQYLNNSLYIVITVIDWCCMLYHSYKKDHSWFETLLWMKWWIRQSCNLNDVDKQQEKDDKKISWRETRYLNLIFLFTIISFFCLIYLSTTVSGCVFMYVLSRVKAFFLSPCLRAVVRADVIRSFI